MIQKILVWDLLTDKMSLANFLFQQAPENGAYTVLSVIPIETTVNKDDTGMVPTKFIVTKAVVVLNPVQI